MITPAGTTSSRSQILAIAFRKAVGTHNAGEVDAEQIERMLQLAYEDAYFAFTELHASIRRWESLSAPFAVLKLAPRAPLP